VQTCSRFVIALLPDLLLLLYPSTFVAALITMLASFVARCHNIMIVAMALLPDLLLLRLLLLLLLLPNLSLMSLPLLSLLMQDLLLSLSHDHHCRCFQTCHSCHHLLLCRLVTVIIDIIITTTHLLSLPHSCHQTC